MTGRMTCIAGLRFQDRVLRFRETALNEFVLI